MTRHKILIASRSFGKVSKRPAEWLESQDFKLVNTDLLKPLTENDMIKVMLGVS